MQIKTVFLLFFLCFSLTVSPNETVEAQSNTIVVPDDYSTITDAIGNATKGDTIFVKNGTYEEPPLVISKTITLVGENANNTIIKSISETSWDPLAEPFPPSFPAAIQINSNNVTVSGFTITWKSGGSESIIVNGNGVHITKNCINQTDGILINGTNNVVSQNMFLPCPRNFFISCTGSHNIIESNYLHEESSGALRVWGSFNTICNNTINSEDRIGIYGNSNIVTENSVTNFGIGIQGSGNEVFSNVVAVLTVEGFNNSFTANDVSHSLWVYGNQDVTTNNTFYNNNFFGDPEFIVNFADLPHGIILFDDGKEGNYWGSYNGTDADSNGIGDTPHIIARDEKDNFPLMEPFVDKRTEEKLIAKQKIVDFLGDVILLDLSKYSITKEGNGTSYPSEHGGLVKQENVIFTLNSSSSEIRVAAVIENGYVSWLHVYPSWGSMIFAKEPVTDSLAESKNMLERYQSFCQNYELNCSHVTLALNLIEEIPNQPADKTFSGNFNHMSDFVPFNVASSNMKLFTTQTRIGAHFTVDGVDVKNKYLGISLGHGTFIFSDTWSLYSIGSLSKISEEEATNTAWETAQAFSETLEYTTDNSSTVLKPDWTKMRSDVGLLMMPGQSHNTAINQELNYVNLGNTTRHPLALYPLWHTLFYFSQPIGDIYGIQVGVWGDTSEIAYCDTFGFLGSIEAPSTTQTSQPIPYSTIILTTIVAIIAVTISTIIVIKRRK